MSLEVKVTDFERSYVRWRIDTTMQAAVTVSQPLPMTLNNVRAPLDARAVVTELATGRQRDFVLTVSCKAEQVWVERDVWHDPPADMCMIAAHDEVLVVKRWDRAGRTVMRYPPALGAQPERHREDPARCFDRYEIGRVERPGRLVASVGEITETLFTDTPAVAQMEYGTGGCHVLLEYPVKIVNFSERERYYQVDTGPVLLPELTDDDRPLIETLQLAFVAHNGSDWAEFLVCEPTAVTPEVKVHHYSRVVRLENVVHRLFAVSERECCCGASGGTLAACAFRPGARA